MWYNFCKDSAPREMLQKSNGSLLIERFLKHFVGRTSGEAALSARNEEREAFRVWGAEPLPVAQRSESGVQNSCQNRKL